MSTVTPTLHKFLVYAPDKTDEGSFQRRLSVRSAHLEAASKLSASGKIKTGGALMEPDAIESPPAERKMVGSVMIFEAATLAEVKQFIENDIYYTAGVWDPEKIIYKVFAPAAL